MLPSRTVGSALALIETVAPNAGEVQAHAAKEAMARSTQRRRAGTRSLRCVGVDRGVRRPQFIDSPSI